MIRKWFKKKKKQSIFYDVSSKMAEEANRELVKIAKRILSRPPPKLEEKKENQVNNENTPDDSKNKR